MTWRFKQILRFGPFRTTISKTGVGYSVGIPGFRYGITALGQRYITIGFPRMGIYWTKFLDAQPKPTINTLPPTQPTSYKSPASQSVQAAPKQEPWWKQDDYNLNKKN